MLMHHNARAGRAVSLNIIRKATLPSHSASSCSSIGKSNSIAVFSAILLSLERDVSGRALAFSAGAKFRLAGRPRARPVSEQAKTTRFI